MTGRFEELAWSATPIGEISLRRRHDPVIGADLLEVKLGDEYLMSSRFTDGEVELARRGLADLDRDGLDVVVGGLGLGYTARAVLDDERVRSLVVVEALDAVVEWHERGLVPGAERLVADPRVTLVHGDFFALARDPAGLLAGEPDRRADAVLVDIDHSPRSVLAPGNASFYTPGGLAGLAEQIAPAGVFALWSDDPPDDRFLVTLDEVFTDARAERVTFPNPYTGGEGSNTIYLARTPG